MQSEVSHSRFITPLGVAGLVGLTLAVYWPVLGFDFVHWDDPWYVLKNPLITSWHPANLWRIATEMSVKNYAPLTTLSLLADHTFFGLSAGGYHLTNLLLHTVNAVLVCWLVARLTNSRSTGLITAVLFAVHPVQIETVAWVSSRKSLLCATFMLASGLCWLRTERSPRQELWGTIWLTLALLSKAAAIVVPPIVLSYDMLVRRKRFADALPRQLGPGFLCLLLLNITMSAQTTQMGGLREHLALSKPHILAVDAVILWKYVGMLVWPSGLSVLYDPPTRGIALSVVLSLCGWIGVGWVSWRLRHRAPLVAFAVATWFWLLFPVLNLFPITTLMNDRYLYLPCLCVFGLTAVAIERALAFVERRNCKMQNANCKFAIPDLQFAIPGWRGFLTTASVLGVVVTYASMSISHLPVWRNDVALWRHTMSRVPELPVVQIQWADALKRNGRTQEAISVLEKTLANGRADEPDRKRIRRRLAEWES